MIRKTTLVLLALSLMASMAAASNSAYKPNDAIPIKDVVVSRTGTTPTVSVWMYNQTRKVRRQISYRFGLSTVRDGGLPQGFTLRMFLPGVKVLSVTRENNPGMPSKKPRLTSDGVVWEVLRVLEDRGVTLNVTALLTAKPGQEICDRALLFAAGQRAPIKPGGTWCYRVIK